MFVTSLNDGWSRHTCVSMRIVAIKCVLDIEAALALLFELLVTAAVAVGG